MRYLILVLCLLFGCKEYWTPSRFPATVALSTDLSDKQKANIIEACMQWNAAVETEVFEIINYNGGSKEGIILFTSKKPLHGALASTFYYAYSIQVRIGTVTTVGVFKHELLHALGYVKHDSNSDSIIFEKYNESQQILPYHIQYIKDIMPSLKDDEKAPEGKKASAVFQSIYHNSITHNTMDYTKEPMKLKIKSNQIRDRIYNVGGHDISFNHEGIGYVNAAYRQEIERALLLQQGFFRVVDDVVEVTPVIMPIVEDEAEIFIGIKEKALEKMFGPSADLSANFTLLLAESGCATIDEAWQEYRKLLGNDAPAEELPVIEYNDESLMCDDEEINLTESEKEDLEEPPPDEVVNVEIERIEYALSPPDPTPVPSEPAKRGRGRPRSAGEDSYYLRNKDRIKKNKERLDAKKREAKKGKKA